MDFMLMDTLKSEELVQRVTIDGREHLDAALARGRGAIVAVPHMGSWDMIASYAGVIGYRIVAVVDPFPDSLNASIVRSRERFGLRVVQVGRAAVRALTQALAANSVVALLCDLEHGPGVDVRFFGRRAVVPGGPAALALKTGAALLPMYQYSTAPGRYHANIDPELAWDKAETKENLMQRIIRRFEDFIRERPDQWFAFRPIFKADR